MALLDDVRDYLGITWETTAGEDAALGGMIVRGRSRIDGYAGAPQDYDAEGQPKELLLDYVRYARSQALEMFEPNFQNDLLNLRINVETQAMADAAETGE